MLDHRPVVAGQWRYVGDGADGDEQRSHIGQDDGARGAANPCRAPEAERAGEPGIRSQ